MQIKAIEKVSMIDYPGKVASTLFLAGCNFKCGYCHNPELTELHDNKEKGGYSEREILKHLEENKKFLDGVCITGGEPTLFRELPEFLKKIRSLGFKIKLDTNGSNPIILKKVLEKHLVDYLAIDIKGPIEKSRYLQIINVKTDLGKIKKSIELAKKFPEYEFRTTCFPGITEKDILKIAKYLNSTKADRLFVLQQFRPDKCLDKEFEKMPKTSEEDLKKFAEIARPFFKKVLIRKE